MGDLIEAPSGDLSFHTQPNAWFHFLGDHAVVFSVLPSRPTGRSSAPPGW